MGGWHMVSSQVAGRVLARGAHMRGGILNWGRRAAGPPPPPLRARALANSQNAWPVLGGRHALLKTLFVRAGAQAPGPGGGRGRRGAAARGCSERGGGKLG
jgi:hypothetical protein